LIVTAIAWAYVRFGKLPQAEGLLYGIKPVIIAVVVQALWVLSRAAIKTKWLALAGLIGVVLSFLGVNELIILFGTGLAIIVTRSLFKRNSAMPLLGIVPAVPLATTSVAASFGLWPLFLFFLKVGSVLFGSGYVLLVFLRADLVERWHWLTENQLMDAIAVGQFTPGPVFTTATFIGYVLHGSVGAVVATVGIFLPAFVFVAISVPLLPRLRRSSRVGAFLDGVNVAALALMVVVTWQLGAGSLVDWPSVSLAVIAAFLLLRYKVNSALLVLGGAGVGLLLTNFIRG
jgi:chromate transporter